MFRILHSESIYKKDKIESIWLLWAFCFILAQSTIFYCACNCCKSSSYCMDECVPTSQDAYMKKYFTLQPIYNSYMLLWMLIFNRNAIPPDSSVYFRIFHYSYITVFTLEQTFPTGKLCQCRFILIYYFFFFAACKILSIFEKQY